MPRPVLLVMHKPPHLIEPILFAGAFLASLFFDGAHSIYFSVAQVFLVAWFAAIGWRTYKYGYAFHISPLAVVIALYWLWLALTLLWTPTPLLSIVTFWWLGSLPFAFWAYTLVRDKDEFWRYVGMLALFAGVCLALIAEVQFFILHREPSSVFININSHAALLNLIALPLSGSLIVAMNRANSKRAAMLALALFVLFLSIALVKGRGASLALFSVMALFLFLRWRDAQKRAVALLVVLLVGAFLCANVSWHGGVVDRLATLDNPTSAGATRFIIWKGAWRLFMHSPWWGTGLGNFAYIWPPYRDPLDTSGGYYVHNDYLQLAIEAGVPGILLFCMALVATLRTFLGLQRQETNSDQRIEQTTLFCALLATAAHSFVDFNLYIIPILLLAGIMLGRLNSMLKSRSRYFHIAPAHLLGVRSYTLIVGLAACVPIVYFVSLALSDYKYQAGLKAAASGDLEKAYSDLVVAKRLSPNSPNVLMSLADLDRHAISVLPVSRTDDRVVLFHESEQLLDESEHLNPYQPALLLTRALLYADNRDLVGARWKQRTEENLQKALNVDPRFLPARVAYSELLTKEGRTRDSNELLEEGAKYWYFPSRALLPFYVALYKSRVRSGDKLGAAQIAASIESIAGSR